MLYIGWLVIYINTGLQCFNATQGHKPSYPTSYISIPNDEDDPIDCLAINKLGIYLKLKERST